MDSNSKVSKNIPTVMLSSFLSIGTGLGISLGVVFGNIPIGLSIGAGVGLTIGVALYNYYSANPGCEDKTK